MKFAVFGGFEIYRKSNRLGVFDKEFWDKVRQKSQDLPEACGCYIFSLKNGSNIVPWYVGKTEKMSFSRECFQATKINYFNEVLIDRRGTPLLFLLPRQTALQKRFSFPTKRGYRDIDFLETMLIGLALEKNKNLMNIKKTTLLKQMVVPGIINSPQARPTKPVADLRNTLGL